MTTTQISASTDANLTHQLRNEQKAFEVKQMDDRTNAELKVLRRRTIEDHVFAKELSCSMQGLKGIEL
jgi:hypothetical protein